MKNTNKNFLFILKSICKAQIASDAGKGIYELTCKNDKNAVNKAYKIKQYYIINALRVLTNSKITNINYWCEQKVDQNNFPSIIVCFDIKINYKRKQVSFHTPLNQACKDLLKYISTGRKTRWDRKIGGSRNACRELIEEFNL